MKTLAARGSLVLPLLLAACTSPPAKPPAETHLTAEDAPTVDTASIPPPVQQTLAPPRPKSSGKTETYSVVVNNVRVHDLLFALARDAKVNVDIHPGIQGSVTLNAVDQTLPQILTRLARQIDMRWELEGQTLSVQRDTPYLQNYKIDYVNMAREASGSVQVSGQIGDSAGSGSGGGGSGGNSSTAKIDNTSKNDFWKTLIKNIEDLLRETDKNLPEGSSETTYEQENSQKTGTLLNPSVGGNTSAGGSASSPAGQIPSSRAGSTTGVIKHTTFKEAASVIAHAESGTVAVRATSRQHEKIQQFVDQVMSSAKRQVLIEATIAEVALSRKYEQGVDWGRFGASATSEGLFISQTGGAIAGAGLFTLSGRSNRSGGEAVTGAIRLLETFGTVKVLSSPKISALNNQSAIMRVVDNRVIFNIKANSVTGTSGLATTTYTTEQKSIPVGFVMSITPQISDSDNVVLNVRPSITRLIGFVNDPNPSLTNAVTGVRIDNPVPNIRTREMETVIRIQDGNIAVLGGLMEDGVSNTDSGVPWFHTIPFIGAFFTQRNDEKTKTELVIFLKPTIIRQGTYQEAATTVKEHLPKKDFFAVPADPRYQLFPSDAVTAGEPNK